MKLTKNIKTSALSVSMALCVVFGAVMAMSQEPETGVLEVSRIDASKAMGKPIRVKIITRANRTHQLEVLGSDTVKTVRLQPGWVQVNCRTKDGVGALGHSVRIVAGRTTAVGCYFRRSAPARDVGAISQVAPVQVRMSGFVESNLLNDALSGSSEGSVVVGAASRKSNSTGRSRGLTMRRRLPNGYSSLQHGRPPLSQESYDHHPENGFRKVEASPTSTFSIDVDTASYANVRRYIEQMNQLPPREAVRVEEFLNYFSYDYGQPADAKPFSIHTEVSTAPWNPKHRLVHVGLKAKDISKEDRPDSNLVFLVDVSGSMNSANKLPLLKSAFSLLVKQLTSNDRVSIVVYASRQGLVLPATAGDQHAKILSALQQLNAGGSTAGGAGIQLAYKEARKHFIKGGNNRVILATDGDFNVGVSSNGGLVKLIEKERESGVFLSVLGFGRGNYKDATMEQLSNHGNGVAAYIDTLAEAKKVLVDEAGGSLVTVAKDVKVQVEFNPAKVASYRLVGYANRQLTREEFTDDKKDAGDMGAGHSVTVLYEVIPTAAQQVTPRPDGLRYQQRVVKAGHDGELLTLKVRYKEPAGHSSTLEERVLIDHSTPLTKTSNAFRFAAAVAQFGMILSQSKHAGTASVARLIEEARAALGADLKGYREGFLKLATKANALVMQTGMMD